MLKKISNSNASTIGTKFLLYFHFHSIHGALLSLLQCRPNWSGCYHGSTRYRCCSELTIALSRMGASILFASRQHEWNLMVLQICVVMKIWKKSNVLQIFVDGILNWISEIGWSAWNIIENNVAQHFLTDGIFLFRLLPLLLCFIIVLFQ